MATITPSALTVNVGTGTVVDTDISTYAGGTEHTIANGTKRISNMLIVAKNTAAGAAKDFVVKAGDGDAAILKSLGDLTVSLPTDVTMMIPVEGARFLKDDGTINFTVAASTTGTIGIIEMQD